MKLLNERLDQYEKRPGLLALNQIKKILEQKKTEVTIESILTPIETKHCIRCHKEFCLEDPNDICMVEHWQIPNTRVEYETNYRDQDDPKYYIIKFNGCGCTVWQPSDVSERWSDYYNEDKNTVRGLDNDVKYCHKGEHLSELKLPQKNDDMVYYDWENLGNWGNFGEDCDGTNENGQPLFDSEKMKLEDYVKLFETKFKECYKTKECKICNKK
jgi:hypothetical protein